MKTMICSTEGNHSIVCHIHIVLPNHLYWGNTAKRSTIFVRGQPQISQFRSLIRLILQPITITASDFPCICCWFPMEKRNKGCPPQKKTWEILKPQKTGEKKKHFLKTWGFSRFHPIFQKTGESPPVSPCRPWRKPSFFPKKTRWELSRRHVA